jgi:hypothetical protein
MGDGVSIISKSTITDSTFMLRREFPDDWDEPMTFCCNLPVAIQHGVIVLTIHTGVVHECLFRDFAYLETEQKSLHFRVPITGGMLPLCLTSVCSTRIQVAVSFERDAHAVTDVYELGSSYYHGGQELTPLEDTDEIESVRSDDTMGGVSLEPLVRTGDATNLIWQPTSGNLRVDAGRWRSE